MKRFYDSHLKATVTFDTNDNVRAIRYVDEFPDTKKLRGRRAAEEYLKGIAGRLAVSPEQLRDLDHAATYLEPQRKDVEFRFSDEKTFFDSTAYVYYQTYLNTPVWKSGITVTVKHNPDRIIGATNTSQRGIDAELPSAESINRYRELFATAEKPSDGVRGQDVKQSKASYSRARTLLVDVIGEASREVKGELPAIETIKLIRGRFFVYFFEPDKRTDELPQAPTTQRPREGLTGPDELTSGPLPTLPLRAVPKSIQPGKWYLVAELILSFSYGGRRMNWRMLVEVETNTIVYLRALTAGVNGLVFLTDPITATGDAANTPAATAGTLNPLRRTVALEGLAAPGVDQALTGEFIQISDFELATAPPPIEPSGTDFSYDTRTNNFAAVSAYYHCDRFFRLVQELGFDVATYFDGTTFPIPVDHRGRFLSADGIELNASCSGDGDGIANVDFELADLTDTANPMGIAADWRVVLHELGGHGILNDHVDTGTFDFAHSAGDSFAVILNDPTTLAADRFESFPWLSAIGRRHDRAVAAGWGWGGVEDDGGYGSEQILSTTMFRVYRSIGGDSTRLTRREFSARVMAYLMLRAVGTLSPVSNPDDPALFLDALLTADAGDWTTEGLFGGAYEKVLTWSFERQDLNGGAPPIVDVYIDDGRGGEYEYLDDFSGTAAIWNRRAPDGLAGHQEPALGTNYAYVKVKNRGSSAADNVAVRGFHCKPLAGRTWPDDLQPMTTPELAAGAIQPSDAQEVTVGPFEWTPVANADGQDGMLMIVSAPGDPSNADKFVAGEEIEDWRLIPNDNNVALRTVRLEPRLVTVIADSGEFGNVCVGSHKDMMLVLSNSGFGVLAVSSITSSSADFLTPSVVSYPIAIGSGDSIAVPIRFEPAGFGPSAATISVVSSDPEGPRQIRVSGEAGPPRLVAIIADHGDFGAVCPDSFADKMLVLNNSGRCPLTIRSITSSSADFIVADVLSFPIVVGAGDSVQVPIRFDPTDPGAKSGTIAVESNDPAGDKIIRVSGKAPSGKLAVTGSTCIGGVKACCVGERTIAICNVGRCALHVSEVGFSRKSKHWRLVNNPFPATLPAGSCLNLLIRYRATEKCPKCIELVIKSDDPDTPVKRLDLMAYTVWPHSASGKSGCECDDECGCGCGDGGCSVQSLDPCCFDEECEKYEGDDDH